jgi:hypothetical protein
MKFLYSFLILTLLTGCQRPSYNIFNGEFRHVTYTDKVELLTGEQVQIDTIGIWETWIEDSLLFVNDYTSEKAFYSIYSLNSNELLYDHLIMRGRGPNEYIEARLFHIYSNEMGVKAWFSVNHRERLLCIDITASILKQQLVVEREVNLNMEDKFALFSVHFDSDTSFVMRSLFNNDQILIYNTVSQNTHSLEWLYTQEYSRQDISDFGCGYVYNASRSILAGGMGFFDQINFFPLKERKPFSISTSPKAIRYDEVKIKHMNDRSRYYGYVCYTEDVIIVTYTAGKDRYKERSPEQNFLHIVSWEGELLKIFETDCYLASISYDKRTSYLYGIDIETDRILRYKLNM